MQPFPNFTTLVVADREKRDNFKTLVSTVIPRPIAFVSTISADGIPNLAPFSFFNAVGTNPPALIFSPSTNSTGATKDTINNLRAVPECVVHVVTHAIREPMNDTSYAFPPEVNEFEACGFTMLPSRFVRPPRAAESPVHMECRLIQIVPVGSGPLSGNVSICEILCFHVADEMLLPDGTVNANKIDLIARLGGDGYATIRDRFDLPKPRSDRPAR
jgi:flavin reductase (DIM6/NTAB) family NADH-FMN oxidoreductase RutF